MAPTSSSLPAVLCESEAERLREELRAVQAKIDAAYWAFTRQARAKPPSLVVPEAYRRRAEIEDLLRAC